VSPQHVMSQPLPSEDEQTSVTASAFRTKGKPDKTAARAQYKIKAAFLFLILPPIKFFSPLLRGITIPNRISESISSPSCSVAF